MINSDERLKTKILLFGLNTCDILKNNNNDDERYFLVCPRIKIGGEEDGNIELLGRAPCQGSPPLI